MPHRLTAAVLLCCAMSGAPQAWADQTDSRLDGLFAALGTADSSDAAKPYVERIWTLWLDSGSEPLQQMLDAGVTAMSSGDYDTALVQFERVIRDKPDFAEGWNRRATLLYLVGDYAGSVRDIKATLALEPRHFGALSGLGLIYMKLARYQDALKVFEKVLTINPQARGARENIRFLKRKLRGKMV